MPQRFNQNLISAAPAVPKLFSIYFRLPSFFTVIHFHAYKEAMHILLLFEKYARIDVIRSVFFIFQLQTEWVKIPRARGTREFHSHRNFPFSMLPLNIWVVYENEYGVIAILCCYQRRYLEIEHIKACCSQAFFCLSCTRKHTQTKKWDKEKYRLSWKVLPTALASFSFLLSITHGIVQSIRSTK